MTTNMNQGFGPSHTNYSMHHTIIIHVLIIRAMLLNARVGEYL